MFSYTDSQENQISPELLRNIFSSYVGVKIIILDSVPLKKFPSHTLVSLLHASPHLRNLSLGQTWLNELPIEELQGIFSPLSYIKQLNISLAQFLPDDFARIEAICTPLKWLRKLECDYTFDHAASSSAPLVSKMLSCFPVLKSCSMRYLNFESFTPEEAQGIFQANPYLRVLDFWENNLSLADAQVVEAIFSNLSWLESLSLERTNFEVMSPKMLSYFFVNQSRLKSLSLDYNDLSALSAYTLHWLFSPLINLIVLHVSETDFEVMSDIQISAMLKPLVSLRLLYVNSGKERISKLLPHLKDSIINKTVD